MFEKLPTEVIDCILDYLRLAHSTGSSLNVRDLQADLRILCMSNKQLHNVASEHLYREIWTPSHTASLNRNLMKFSRPLTRLQRLLRTLKESPALAALVRCIRVNSKLAKQLENRTVDQGKPRAVSVLSDIIKKCKNLETCLGYAPNAVEITSGLHDALASSLKLKSHVWRLPTDWMGPSEFDLPRAFAGCHTNWTQLETLVLIQPRGGLSLLAGTISGIVQRLPALKHLVLSGMNPGDFHNGTLLMLPPLKSLRLEELHGITDQGLEQLARSRAALSLERVVLYSLEITSLRTIQVLLSEIVHLKRFTLLQQTSPELSQTSVVASTTFSLSSSSLEFLHWDVLAGGHSTTILANSIASGRFPSLRTVKVPCDNDGAIQRLCRPISHRPLTQEDVQLFEHYESMWGYFRSLQYSQLQAQIRVSESRQQPSFNVVVQDEDAAVQHRHFIGSYLGNMGSNIEYSLEPAIARTSTAVAETRIATYPARHLSGDAGTVGYYENPDDTKEFVLDLDVFF